MPKKPEPTSPLEAYKAIIDELVGETSQGVSEQLVRRSGIFSKSPEQRPANELVASLNPEQRQVLAEMLHKERVSAIHDVLAVLSWWMECREVAMTFRGAPMPVGVSGEGLHGDYVGRCDGWEWTEGEP